MTVRVVTFEHDMLPLGPAVAAIGVFDGVHIGHQALVRTCRERAEEHGVSSVVLTFDRDPDRVVAPDRAAPQLQELSDKLAALAALGVDSIVVVPFEAGIAAMSPERFVDDVLLAACTPTEVIVGRDFRFGRAASGDVAALATLGTKRSFSVAPQPLVHADGAPVTSTRIRSLVASGDVAAAARLLGRPHRLRGTVARGRGIGARLGAPTANLRTHGYAAVPASGVYAAWAHLGSQRMPAAVSVGAPPTFPEVHDGVEVHLLDYEGPDLYGRELAVDFVDRLRDLARFEGEADLADAIARDVARVREVLGVQPG